MGNGGKLLSISSISKPAATIDSKAYKMINHTYNYPGTVKWEPITMKFVDGGGWGDQSDSLRIAGQEISLEAPPQSRMTSAALWEMLLASGYTPPSGETGFSARATSISSPEKAATMDLSFGKYLKIHQLTPAGTNNSGVIRSWETWEIHNPTITKISWGDLDYGDDGLVEYTMDVTYDWAVHHVNNPNDTELVQRLQPGLNPSLGDLSNVKLEPMGDLLKRNLQTNPFLSDRKPIGGLGDFNPSQGPTIT